MESWHGRQLGEAAGLWQRSPIKMFCHAAFHQNMKGDLKEGSVLILKENNKSFSKGSTSKLTKNKANFYFKRNPCKKAIISPSLKKKRKSPATIQAHGELLSVYFTAYRCTNLSVCCLLRRSGNVNGTESGTENESGNGTVCSQREQVNVSETWSETLSGTWSETWTLREIWRRPCPLLMTSSLECDWQTWSGSWNGCGSWNGSWSGSSCGNESDSCCDSWKKIGNFIPLVLFSFITYGITEEQIWSDSVGVCKTVKNNPPSAVLKDFQLASIQFGPIQLGNGILHVTSRCKLNHSVLKQKHNLGPNPVDKMAIWEFWQPKSNSPFIFVGSVSVHKGNFTCFSHQVFQVLFQSIMQA